MSSIYFIAYNGRIESGDTLSLFNATASLAQYNDMLLDKSAWQKLLAPVNYTDAYPLEQSDVEPLQLILSVIPFTLAKVLPNIGLVHAVWLFNVVICSLIVSVFFLYTTVLGYSSRIAVIAALLLGLGSIIWPYSKSYFREPLACLMFLLAAFFIELWRRKNHHISWPLLGILLAVSGSFLTKDATILLTPALIILGFPRFTQTALFQSKQFRLFIRVIIIIFIAVGLLFAIISFVQAPLNLNFNPIYGFIGSIFKQHPTVIRAFHVALHSYLLSIGGSVWGTSPILLLAVPGLWMLYRSRQYRYLLVIIAAVLSLAFAYAFFRGVHWFGGLSWPPRFLLPAVPLVMIGVLPFLNKVLSKPVSIWIKLTVGLLIIYSLWIQVSAVSLDWGAYNAALPPEANGLGEWGGGLNTIQYLRWVIIPTLWSQFPLDFAWVRNNVPAWPIAYLLIAAVCGVALWRTLGSEKPVSGRRIYRIWMPQIALLALLLLTIYLGLQAIYRDDIYRGKQQSLFDIMPIIQQESQPGDILLLSNNNYAPFFLNYGKFAWPRMIVLPDQPGESATSDQLPMLISNSPDALLDKFSIPLMTKLAQMQGHLWLLADTGPWISGSVRPVERFLTAHYYPIRELSTNPPDPTVRLIEYSTVAAPDPFAFRGANYLSDLQYGDTISLTGFDLPSGTTYKPGDILPLSLYWETDSQPEADYTVAWFVADSQGNPVAQGEDTQPVQGFAPTSAWKTGTPVWDNRALYLPDNLAPGSYRIWVRLYGFDSTNTPAILPVTGAETRDGITGVLPVEIHIN